MVRTGVIKAVEEEETNVGASKTTSIAARLARAANLKKANLKKGGRKKRKISLGIVNSQKFVVAVAELAPAPSILFKEPSNDHLTPAEIEGHSDSARRVHRWKELINSRNTKIEAHQQQIETQQQQLAQKDAEIQKMIHAMDAMVAEKNSGLKRLSIEHDSVMEAMWTIDYTVEIDLNAYPFLAKYLYDDSLRFSFMLLGK